MLVPLVLPLLAGGSAGAQPGGGWLVYGNDPGRSSATSASLSPPSVRPAWYTPVSGRISSQALVALDLATGQERPGWPVCVYGDFRRELVWGALTIVDGSVYFGTGSYCDRKMEGKVFRVGLGTREVKRWVSVPFTLGGGGGIWG